MQVPPVEKPDRPKILGPKPTIASKPKHLPPVRKVSRDDLQKNNISKQNETNNDAKRTQQSLKTTTTTITTSHQIEKKTDKYSSSKNNEETFQSYIMPSISGTSKQETQQQQQARKCQNEKCDKFRIEEKQKGPPSPSTVCCSILSSATTDCCGIIPTYKKELNSKMNKMESVDSNSSDSGGFKDFIQLDLISNNKDATNVIQRESYQMHQRNISHPEFQEKKLEPHQQQKTHQRYGSQPEYVLQQQQHQQKEETVRKHYVPNAQALAQYLPLTEQKMMKPSSTISYDVPDTSSTASNNVIRQHITKFNISHQLVTSIDKTDNINKKPPLQQQQSTTTTAQRTTNNLLSHGQFQQSTKKLEELLSQRLEREKLGWKGQTCLVDGESSQQDVDQKMFVQKQIQQKLQADLKQTVKQIQEIQSIELRLPQNRKWNEVSSL